MKKTELAEIALKFIQKGYSWEDMMNSDDLYNATDEEKDLACELYDECKEIWTWAFYEKY